MQGSEAQCERAVPRTGHQGGPLPEQDHVDAREPRAQARLTFLLGILAPLHGGTSLQGPWMCVCVFDRANADQFIHSRRLLPHRDRDPRPGVHDTREPQLPELFHLQRRDGDADKDQDICQPGVHRAHVHCGWERAIKDRRLPAREQAHAAGIRLPGHVPRGVAVSGGFCRWHARRGEQLLQLSF